MEKYKPEYIKKAESYIEKAYGTHGPITDISKYIKMINIIIKWNKQIEQEYRKTSEEMEEVENMIDKINKTKPLSIDGYIPDSSSTPNIWCDNRGKDREFIELYEFYNDINYFHSKELISGLLLVKHEDRPIEVNDYSLNKNDLILMKDINIINIGDNYCTGVHMVWGKIYIPKEQVKQNNLDINSTFTSIVKLTNDTIPWRVPDNYERNVINNNPYNNSNKFCIFNK